MAKLYAGKTVNEVWEKAYKDLAAQAALGKEQDSRDGSVVGEILNAVFEVEDPTRMIVTSDIRKMPMRYAVGELMWYMSGSNKTSDISQFSKVWDKLSDDGEHSNSAYGYRIHHKFGFDQWEAAKKMLMSDSMSRQAVIHIKEPLDNVTVNSTKDLPCTLNLQFLIRDNKLHLTVHMRSNDIWTGTPYDMFAFCCMQIKMAMELGVEVGTYTHTAVSLHLYGRNYTPVKEHETDNEDVFKPLKEINSGNKKPIDKSKVVVDNCHMVNKLSELGRVIAVDFDGTLFCGNDYPSVSEPNVDVINELKRAYVDGAKIIIWTCRSKGHGMEEALAALARYGIPYDSINENIREVQRITGYDTRKVWATEYWDDKAVRCSKEGVQW